VRPPLDAFEAGLRIARALERAAVPYALGGALAYGQYGIPRATNDVDVNVFVGPASLHPVADALRSLGITVDDEAARQAAEAEGLIVLRYEDLRLDVFTPSIAFSWEAERTRVQHTIDDTSVWFLSVEALCVFKMLFFRGKDVVDIERLIAVQRDAIDRAYVRAWLVDMMGADDPRVATWDRLWAAG
jgi:hypothetical protein